MDDSVLVVHHAEMGKSEIRSILCKRVHLCLADRVLYGLVLIMSRGVVVRHTKNLIRAQALESALSHSFKCLWRCHLMAVQPVDIKLCGPVLHVLYHMGVPYFIK